MADPRTLGLPAEFEFEGRCLKVAPRSFAHEAAFRRWLEGEALRAIQRHKDALSELEYQQMLAGWRQDCAVGSYSYPMPLCIQGLVSIEGAKRMALICLKEHNPEVNEAMIERLFADDAKWEELRTIRKGLDDPNSRKPGHQAPAAS